MPLLKRQLLNRINVIIEDVIVYRNRCYPQKDWDGIICQETLDPFCTVFKAFSFIEGHADQKKSHQSRNDGNLAERQIFRLKFWEDLLEKAKTRTNLHANISPGKENWISAGAGKRGLGFNYVVRMDDAQLELYIDNDEVEWNKRILSNFLQRRSEMEQIFGEPLDWQLLPDKRASRIRFVISSFGLIDQDQWDELQEQLINSMIRMEKAIGPFINLILSQNG